LAGCSRPAAEAWGGGFRIAEPGFRLSRTMAGFWATAVK
jgi:hypothetical protein